MPDLPPEPVKAAEVVAEAIARADGGDEVWDEDDQTAASLIAALSERAGGDFAVVGGVLHAVLPADAIRSDQPRKVRPSIFARYLRPVSRR